MRKALIIIIGIISILAFAIPCSLLVPFPTSTFICFMWGCFTGKFFGDMLF